MGSRRRLRFGCLAAAAVAAVCSAAGAGGAVGGGGATIVSPPLQLVQRWTPETANRKVVTGTIRLGGRPVAGVRVRVGGYTLPASTGADGVFAAAVDDTVLGRLPVTVADASRATLDGASLTGAQRSALDAARGAVQVAYAIEDLTAHRGAGGEPVVTGRLASPAGAPPRVVYETYALGGTVTDADGKPVAGALVSTRTQDRDFWTVSTPTDAHGHYTSRFTASDEASDNPVPMTVRIAVGNTVYQFLPAEFVYFRRLQSATMDLELPPAGFPLALPLPRSFAGAVYAGTVVGAAGPNGVVRPVRTTWTDARGRFEIVFPKRLSGASVDLWEGTLDLFSVRAAEPGGDVDLRDWPTVLTPGIPRDLARVRLP
jgi:hypothetical protein